jgi:type IX secretion system PorP/SprF family membrane protein
VVVKRFILILLVILTSKVSSAQDVHLSQFYTAQLNLNPALGGYYNGEFRVAGNYRSQWSQINKPITTAVIAVDRKYYLHADEIDAGIIIINDQFAGYNMNTNKIFISGSYLKKINYNEFRVGLQAGMVLKSTDLTTQTFPNQWTYSSGEFDPNVSNGENTIADAQNFIDLNIGAAWSKAFKGFKPLIGFSLFHVNRPKDTFFDSPAQRLRRRQVIHGEAVIDLNELLTLEPKAMYMWTAKAQDMLIGTTIKRHFKTSKVQNIYGGLLYRDGFGRNNDAIIPVIGLTYNRFDIGFSYDLNLSGLSNYSPRKSSLEFSLIYTGPLFSPKNLSIPCDRY